MSPSGTSRQSGQVLDTMTLPVLVPQWRVEENVFRCMILPLVVLEIWAVVRGGQINGAKQTALSWYAETTLTMLSIHYIKWWLQARKMRRLRLLAGLYRASPIAIVGVNAGQPNRCQQSGLAIRIGTLLSPLHHNGDNNHHTRSSACYP